MIDWFFHLGLLFLQSFLLCSLGLGVLRLKSDYSPGEPWYAESRSLYPLLTTVGLSRWYFFVYGLIYGCFCLGDHKPSAKVLLFVVACCFLSYLGALLSSLCFLRGLPRPKTPWILFSKLEGCKAFGILVGFFFLFCSESLSIIAKLPPFSGVIAGGGIILVLHIFGLGFFNLKLFGLVSKSPEWLSKLVEEAAQTFSHKPEPKTFLIKHSLANAFAAIFWNRLYFTEPMLSVLEKRELYAIALHEISHLRESVWDKLMRLSPLVAIITISFGLFLLREVLGILPIIFIGALSIWGIGKFADRLSRKLEDSADKQAYSMAKEDKKSYGEALEKIYRHNFTPVVLGVGSHPDLYDRMIEADAKPDYERPAPPRTRLSAFIHFAVVFLSTLTALRVHDI